MALRERLKSVVPWRVRFWLAPITRRLRIWRQSGRWLRMLRGAAPTDQARAFYGFEHIPGPHEPAAGGLVKVQHLQELYSNTPVGFNVLYLVSSNLPLDWPQLLWVARRKRAAVVLNQNGVAYPAWKPTGWQAENAQMAKLLHTADYVLYQSDFCRRSADHFLGVRRGSWEICYNTVDTSRFRPADTARPLSPLMLLAMGSAHAAYRIECALYTLAYLRQWGCNAHLLLAGRYMWGSSADHAMAHIQKLCDQLCLSDHVTVLGRYKQVEAPQIYQRGHILLHTQYNDASPGVVLEALACGLPVVYSQTGGVPELVGPAGIGVSPIHDWERVYPAAPHALASAVLEVVEHYDVYAHAARQRAVEEFALPNWIARHQVLFEQLIGRQEER